MKSSDSYEDTKSDSSDSYEVTKSDSDDDNDDNDFLIYKVKSAKIRTNGKEEDSESSPEQSPKKLSSYEEMIAKNRAEGQAFLQSLKLEEAKAGFYDAVNTVKEQKRVPQKVKRVYQQTEKKSPVVRRKSRRLENKNLDLSEDALYERSVREAQEAEEVKIERIPPVMTFSDALQSSELYDSFEKDVEILRSDNFLKRMESEFMYKRSILKNLNLEEKNIAKLTPDRISALGWYPSAEHLIVAAGSKYGNLSIWNVKSDSNPYLFKIHYGGITCLKFNPYNPVQMFTSSYDGILRCGDLAKHVFEEVYDISDISQCTYFDFLSANTFLVALRNGEVAIVDNRLRGKCSKKTHTCHDYSIKTVDINPVDKNFFVSAENKGSIRLWDLRRLQKQPVADVTHHKRCVNSAFFSPVTGKYILTTSADDTICIFDTTTQDIKLKKSMAHNNFTGRWLSVFRAAWLPNCDDAFVVGSMSSPRRIEVYDNNLDLYHNLQHSNLTTITSTNVFHPYVPALAGANSSGKVFVFT